MKLKKILIDLYSRFRNLILYGIIGGFCASLDFCIYTFLCHWDIMPYLWANIISIHIGILTSFVLNRSFNFKVKEEGEYKFCFENLAPTKVTLSFEFDYGTNDYGMISIKTIENFVHVVDNLEKKLKKLQFNIRNSAVRKKAHFNIANSIRNKINIYAFAKIGFLILFSIFQLMMITSIFNNVKVVKQININSETKPLKHGKNSETTDFL